MLVDRHSLGGKWSKTIILLGRMFGSEEYSLYHMVWPPTSIRTIILVGHMSGLEELYHMVWPPTSVRTIILVGHISCINLWSE